MSTSRWCINSDKIPKALNCIEELSVVSRLKMNFFKYALFTLKTCNSSTLHGIDVKNNVFHLRIRWKNEILIRLFIKQKRFITWLCIINFINLFYKFYKLSRESNHIIWNRKCYRPAKINVAWKFYTIISFKIRWLDF